MATNREERLMNSLENLLPLIGQQMLTATRVMSACGHQCTNWYVPDGVVAIICLPCIACGDEAEVHLLDTDGGARYTVLLLPPGMCKPQAGAPAPEGANHAR